MVENVLTIDEAADRLRLHRTTVRGLIKDGRLKATAIGRTFRLTEKAVADFLASEAKPVRGKRKKADDGQTPAQKVG